VGILSVARETPVQRREACIHSKDRKYVFVDGSNPQFPLYRLTCAGCPCIELKDGIVQRFRNGAEIATLAVDYGATPRAIEAAVRTMHRFWEGLRS